MKSPLILAVMCLASHPAMAGGSTIEKTTPATDLEICTIKLRNTSDLLQQIIRKASAPPAAVVTPIPQAKPASVAPARNSKGCKKGRTRNARGLCGVWS
jgi:hypothetical protein